MTTWTRWLLMLALLLAATSVQAGTKHYYYTDAQGTVLAKADAQGNIVASYDYTPYGVQVLGTPPSGPTGYTGHVNDAESGFVYMQQRYYDPVVGRFLSVDPSSRDLSNISNFGRYTYAGNNPIIKIDPDGRASIYTSGQQVTVIQTFHNKGTQFSDQQIADQGINLSGRASDGKMVVVILLSGTDSDAVKINTNEKLNDLSKNAGDRSHIDKIGGRDVQIAPNAQGPGTVGHEIGHALKAGDQYKGGVAANGQPITENVPGTTNIMRDAVGPANQQTVDEIKKGVLSQ